MHKELQLRAEKEYKSKVANIEIENFRKRVNLSLKKKIQYFKDL